MKQTKRILIIIGLTLSMMTALFAISCVGCWIGLNFSNGGFSRNVESGEKQIRLSMISGAEKWLGTLESSERHRKLLEVYNAHEPLARGYEVTPADNWCATFGSAVAIEQSLTDIVPTECGCERQIELWKDLGRWTEQDSYLPLPGDYIYYNWIDKPNLQDNTGWSDHVGIVVGTAGPMIKVIEGNKDDSVTYRIIIQGDYRIRGYGLPDYASKTP